MGTTAAVLSLVGAIVGFAVWLIKRKATQHDARTPADRVQEHMDEVDREMVEGDAASASARLDRWMRALKNRGGSGRPLGDPGVGRPNSDGPR